MQVKISCISLVNILFEWFFLFQFLEETDYVLAFKSLSEKSTSFDAMDAYYAFIWDPALLEFIVNLHHKRGESKRRQQAVSFMHFFFLYFWS